jgi:mannosyltransferase
MESEMETDTAISTKGRASGAVDNGFIRPNRTLYSTAAIATGVTAVAVLCAVALRWFNLAGQSLYVDEGQTNFAANLSPAKIIRFAQSSDAPPLYFLLEHYWIALFGNSESALRAMSALFGSLSLPVFYLMAKKVLKDSMAVALAMWLFAFSMAQIWYSREARTYEMASFLAVVSLYALILFLERPRATSFITIVLAAVASLYSHNMMLIYVFALNIVWLTYPSERTWTRRLRELLLADVLIGAFYLPWLPSLSSQASVDIVQKYFWAPRPTVRTLFATMSFIAGLNRAYLGWLPSRFLSLPLPSARLLVDCAIGLVCAIVLVCGLWRLPKADRKRSNSLLLFGLIPIFAIFVLSQITTPLFIDRIFTNSSVVIPIVFAFPMTLRTGRREPVLYGVLSLVLAVAMSLSAFGYCRYQQKDDWRDAIRSLLGIPERNRLIVFVPRMGELLFDYYIQKSPAGTSELAKFALPVSYLASFPPPRGGQIHEAELNRLKHAVESGKYPEIDLLLSRERHDDPNETVAGYLSEVDTLVEEKQFFGVRYLRFVAARQLSAEVVTNK